MLDFEAQHGVSGKRLTEALYGPLEGDSAFDPRTNTLYKGVLMPLIWAGLLNENMELGQKLTERVYSVTPLWKRYLELDLKQPRMRGVH